MPVNTATSKQGVVRAQFGNLSQQWRGLTSAQRTEWNTQAVTITLVDSLGQQYTPSGQQWFVGLNTNRIRLALAVANTPPAQGAQAVITALSVTAVGATGVVTATFAPAIGAAAFFELLATPPMSAGRTFMARALFKTLGYLGVADTSPYVATAAWAAVYGGLAAGDVGKLIGFRLRPFTSSGYAGVPFDARTIIT